MAKPRKSPAKGRRDTDTKVSVEFDYSEASLLVVAANVLFGAMPDEETQHSLSGLLDKLYKAEPRLKSDARRIETEMRGFLGSDDMDVEDDDDELPALEGSRYLEYIASAMDEGQAISLSRKDGVLVLHPTGIGQIGGVAVAIGWSFAHEDYAIVRLDEVTDIDLAKPKTRPPAANLAKASLDRLCRKPPTRGRLL